ncbi:hypothetical protein [Mycobacteroides abscessus]|uniref:hypothetical protein n=1 Tax=Mycobacteroides abscessus TaxID=36809 RepID=UPI000C25C23D|nr:hypothetical protein [Mycobacteroides abscessus]RIR12836.1 hypothetical protein D2E27_16200 [Mycobacteroides abscessus]RIR65830.1 hypothetical protein D2E62_14435 [Mycobacteroides abscessus]RIS08573.1 hypothetical protein D2E58_01565 [Mycobacteroides abscessus]
MPPRKRARRPGGAELRTEILAELRDCLGPHAEPGGVFHEHLIAPLEGGDAVQVHRYDLPDWHSERFAGEPHELVWLDVVTPAIVAPR